MKFQAYILTLFLILYGYFMLYGKVFSKNDLNKKNLRRIVLDNGFVVLLQEKWDVPMIHMQMWVRAGSITENENMGSGLSHYFEHMLGKRTKNRKNESFYTAISRMGGYNANAYTAYDRTVYFFTVQNEYLDKATEMFSDMMKNTVLDEEQSKNEIKVILKEMNLYEDSSYHDLHNIFMRTAYTKHPYRYPIIGYRSIFTNLTKKKMLNYYNKMYSSDNMFLVMVGAFNLDEAEKIVKKYFNSLKRRSLLPLYIPKEPEQTHSKEIIKELSINETQVHLGYHTVSFSSPDAVPLDVLSIILGKGKTSRLYKKLKDEKSLVYNILSSSWTPKYPGIFSIYFKLDYKNLNEVKKIINQEINNIKLQGVDFLELEKAKRIVQVNFIKKQESMFGYANNIALSEFIGNLNYNKLYLEAVKKVTNKDIIKVVQKYLKLESLTTVIGKPKIEKYNLISKTKFENKETKFIENKIDKIVLSNGLTLLLKVNKNLPIVNISAMFKGGTNYENLENQGIYNLFVKNIIRGTKTKSKKEINQWIAQNGGTLNVIPNIFNNFFELRGKFLKEDYKKALELFLDILINANFPTEELEKTKKDVLNIIKTREDNIRVASYRHLMKIRYKNHSNSFDNYGTKDSIKSIKRSDLLNLYKNVITADNMILSIFGDFDKNTILKWFEKNNKMNHNLVKLPKIVKPEKLKKSINSIYYKKDQKKQSIIKLLFDAPSIYEEDRFTLRLLSFIFSGPGSRLFLDLREKKGLAYSVSGFYSSGINIGQFIFDIATESDKKEKAIKGIFQNIKLIQEKLISESEYQAAKNSAISEIINSLETLDGQSFYASTNEHLGLGYDYFQKYLYEIKKITRQDILNVARKYLNTNKYVISIVESNK